MHYLSIQIDSSLIIATFSRITSSKEFIEDPIRLINFNQPNNPQPYIFTGWLFKLAYGLIRPPNRGNCGDLDIKMDKKNKRTT